MKPDTIRIKIFVFIMEVRNRIWNAYDFLVKGIDPYER